MLPEQRKAVYLDLHVGVRCIGEIFTDNRLLRGRGISTREMNSFVFSFRQLPV